MANFKKELFMDRLIEKRENMKKGKNKKQFSQQDIADEYKKKFGTIRKRNGDDTNLFRTVQNWEQGKTLPTCDVLFNLCELFKCDADYLLGRIDNTTHDLKFITNETGLEENTIKNLKSIKSFSHITNYISKNLIPYSFSRTGKNELNKLFDSMEKFIQENDDRNSALCMLEIQEALTNLKQNINDKTSNNPQKRLF